jgi:hydrogenase expression/formation protein HypD
MTNPATNLERGRIHALAAEIRRKCKRHIRLMEVCGGHTAAIHKYGLPSLLPPAIELISGPGCPVCVSGQSFINAALEISRSSEVIIATYGDLVRVPGTGSSLEKEKGRGADIRMVYSVMEALRVARENPGKKIVFLGIGFETTAPASAVAIKIAGKEKLRNFFVFSAHKIMPPAMEALCCDGLDLDGFLAPGHVSAITGWDIFRPLVDKYQVGVVVSGFEPVDIMQSVLMLVNQAEKRTPMVENQYRRVVSRAGNEKAKAILDEVFATRDDEWRGLGMINESGLRIREQYKAFDAEDVFNIRPVETPALSGCICGDILKGRKRPADCPLFGSQCTPEDPAGACMVSSEGTCSIFYKYTGHETR